MIFQWVLPNILGKHIPWMVILLNNLYAGWIDETSLKTNFAFLNFFFITGFMKNIQLKHPSSISVGC